MADRHRLAGVLAGTFVELWLLAGSDVAAGIDVAAWIDEIVQRRVTESQAAALSAAISAWPGPGSLGAQWAQGVEQELTGLLRWRQSSPAAPTRRPKNAGDLDGRSEALTVASTPATSSPS
ncbi:hypothetical protein [Winogradskya consettensis]|uniref:hypothetical protein n=1 Tax=Winogradskya consettensis TaxID=113560 RepID=UPI001BB3A32D|nr:hypothetical protein [Actinoplanes consettensis]